MGDNLDTIDTIVDDMLNDGHTGPADELEWVQAKMKFYAERIKEAWKRQCSQSWHHREMEELILRHEREVNELQRQQIGNAAAMREALERLLNLAYEVQDLNSEDGIKTSVPTQFIIDVTKSALSAPPRNCDLPYNDSVEMYGTFKDWCKAKGHTMEPMLACDAFDWMLSPATEQKVGK